MDSSAEGHGKKGAGGGCKRKSPCHRAGVEKSMRGIPPCELNLQSHMSWAQSMERTCSRDRRNRAVSLRKNRGGDGPSDLSPFSEDSRNSMWVSRTGTWGRCLEQMRKQSARELCDQLTVSIRAPQVPATHQAALLRDWVKAC